MEKPFTRDVSLAVNVLRHNGIVAIPTETVYGLAACALDEQAVLRVFDVKNRPRDHPLIVHVSSLDQARQWGVFTKEAMLLAQRFWPGPLTLLLKKTSIVPLWVTGGRETVALRMPDHVMTLSLIEDLGEPLVAPSANRFGQVSPTTAQHVLDDLGEDVDLILDGGSCNIGVESTIVECISDVQILRPGAITKEHIEEELSASVSNISGPSRAPGMMKSHYAPQAKVVLVASRKQADEQAGLLSGEGFKVCVLDEPDLVQFARTLYTQLRQADIDHNDVIVAVLAPPGGIGDAINDRLTKAAADSASDRETGLFKQ